MPRPTTEAPTPIPALPPALRELEGGLRLADDTDVGMDTSADVDTDVDVETDVVVDTDRMGVEDGVVLLVMDEMTEDDVVELDVACTFKDCGGRA